MLRNPMLRRLVSLIETRLSAIQCNPSYPKSKCVYSTLIQFQKKNPFLTFEFAHLFWARTSDNRFVKTIARLELITMFFLSYNYLQSNSLLFPTFLNMSSQQDVIYQGNSVLAMVSLKSQPINDTLLHKFLIFAGIRLLMKF